MKDLFYQFPTAAYLFFLIPFLLVAYWSLFLFRHEKLAQFAMRSLWKAVVLNRSTANYGIKVIGLCLTLIFLILALMDPVGYGYYGQEKSMQHIYKRPPHEVTLLLDASASMNVNDINSKKTRFEFSKEIAEELLNLLQGDSIAIYAFTNQLIQLVPPTYDYLFARMMLRELQINEGGTSGTDLTEAIKQIKSQYDLESEETPKSLIILSDGGDQEQSKVESLLAGIKEIVRQNGRLFTIGIGSITGGVVPNVQFEGKSVTSRLEEKLLKTMSEQGKGKYIGLQGQSARTVAKDLAAEYSKRLIMEKKQISSQEVIHDRYYQFPLAAALLMLILHLFWPARQNDVTLLHKLPQSHRDL